MTKPEDNMKPITFDPPPIGIGRSTYPEKAMPINEWHKYIRDLNEKMRRLSNILKS